MAKAGSKTLLRVIKGHVGKYDTGEIFAAEDEGADVSRLINLGVVEFVSFAASPLPVDPTEFDTLKAQAVVAMDGVGRAAEVLGISMSMENLGDAAQIEDIARQYASEHETLITIEESTRKRSGEISTEIVTTHQEIIRGFESLGVPYDSSQGTAQLASGLADAIASYVRKKHDEILADAIKAEAANNASSGEVGKSTPISREATSEVK